MKNRASVVYVLAAVVALAGLTTVLVKGGGRTPRPAVGVGPKQPMAPRTAAPKDRRPLKERAKEAGHFVKREGPKGQRAFGDLGELTRDSTAVIIGIPTDNLSRLSADGQTITLDYKVRVEYVYKGGVQQGSTITVSLPGGKWSFGDGTTAEVSTPWFKKMQDGKAYALFLTGAGREQHFVPTGEAQGVFEIPTTKEDQLVKAHTGLPQDRVKKYHHMDVKTFLTELRRVTGKELDKRHKEQREK